MLPEVRTHLMDSDEIRSRSVCRVYNSLVTKAGMPLQGGLMDPRMGTADRRILCATCKGTVMDCPGHNGHIQLPFPVVHPQLLDLAVRQLRGFCFVCGALSSTNGRKMCAHCRVPRPLIAKVGETVCVSWTEAQIESVPSKTVREFMRATGTLPGATEIAEAFQSVPASVLAKLGITRSSLLALTPDVLVVPPPVARPCATMMSVRAKLQDELTSHYAAIVRAAEKGSVGPETSAKIVSLVSGLHHGAPSSSGRAKNLVTRLNGKTGRMRFSLQGKRVNFSARGVIAPDMTLTAEQVRVPAALATVLTIPEVVTTRSLVRLQACVDRGHGLLGGAENVVIQGRTTSLMCGKRPTVREGDTVERYLQNGDLLIVNRQPSLHMHSMICHTAVIGREEHTIGLPLCVCPALNADFDGDECNIHVPQTPMAMAEAWSLMRPRSHMLAPKHGRLCMVLVQDALVGAYLLSKRERRLTRVEVLRLATVLPDPPAELLEATTGLEILSALLPPSFCMDAWGVKIRGGVILPDSAPLTKGSLNGDGGVLQGVTTDVGEDAAVDLMTQLQFLCTEYAKMCGFSVGLADCVIPPESRRKVRSLLHDVELQISGSSSERQACQTANSVLAGVSELCSQTGPLDVMVACSKGSRINLGQIRGAVGQSCIEGKRPLFDLPSFVESGVPYTRGLISASYTQGIDPCEFFMHTASGREGVVDTNIKTSSTGYMQRRAVKVLESNVVHRDLSVRSMESGALVELLYGGDGLDPRKLQRATCSLEVLVECPHTADGLRPLLDDLRAIERVAWLANVSDTRKRSPEVTLFSPYSFARGVLRAGTEEPTACSAAPQARADLIRRFCGDMEKELTPNGALHTKVLAWSTLGTCALSEPMLERVLCEARAAVRASRIPVGDMVGIVAAQSCGEPLTQSSLSQFHHAGVGDLDCTLGLPRAREIFDMSRATRTPVVRLGLLPPFNVSRSAAELFGMRLLAYPVSQYLQLQPVGSHGIQYVADLAVLRRACIGPRMIRQQISSLYKSCLERGRGNNHMATLLLQGQVLHSGILPKPAQSMHPVQMLDGTWGIKVASSCLPELLMLDGVDPSTSSTNAIPESFEHLGLLAGRSTLFTELGAVMDGAESLHERHIRHLAMAMTHTGTMMPLSRYGVSGAGLLSRASFETTAAVMLNAGFKRERSHVADISSSSVLGHVGGFGTGTRGSMLHAERAPKRARTEY